MKRYFLTFFAVVLSLVLGMFAVGCGGDTSSPSEKSSDSGKTEHTVHTLTKVEAVKADCRTEGNIEYYTCSGCDKLFADEEGRIETTLADVKLAKTAHTPQKVIGASASAEWPGTEGHYYCTVCGQYLVKDGDNYVETDRTDWNIYYDYINTVVPGKMKHMDQDADKVVDYVNVEKDGAQVTAVYFNNSTPWEDREYDDGENGWNWGFSEFRIALTGQNITKISFEYKINGTTTGKCNMTNTSDKSHGMTHVIEYKDSRGYTNVTNSVYGKEFLTLDNEWHTFTLEVEGYSMENILLKLYHFQGEMWVTDYRVYF